MVKVTLNGKRFECVSCKEELTIGQYQRIIKEWGIDQPDLLKRDNKKLFSILTNSDFNSFMLTEEHEQAIFECIYWVFSETFAYSKEVPKVLQIGDKVIDLPKSVGGCSIGQNIILAQLNDKAKYINENISMATAIYLQPIYDGKPFNLERAKELEQEISKMPANLIYPIGFFLLSRAKQSGNPFTRHRLPVLHSLKQNLKGMWLKWLK